MRFSTSLCTPAPTLSLKTIFFKVLIIMRVIHTKECTKHISTVSRNNERNAGMPGKLKNEIYKQLYGLPIGPSLTSSPKASSVPVNHSHNFPHSFHIYVNFSNLNTMELTVFAFSVGGIIHLDPSVTCLLCVLFCFLESSMLTWVTAVRSSRRLQRIPLRDCNIICLSTVELKNV